jgi:hypothetical protein
MRAALNDPSEDLNARAGNKKKPGGRGVLLALMRRDTDEPLTYIIGTMLPGLKEKRRSPKEIKGKVTVIIVISV